MYDVYEIRKDFPVLAEKIANLPKEFTQYNLVQKGLSLEDMMK